MSPGAVALRRPDYRTRLRPPVPVLRISGHGLVPVARISGHGPVPVARISGNGWDTGPGRSADTAPSTTPRRSDTASLPQRSHPIIHPLSHQHNPSRPTSRSALVAPHHPPPNPRTPSRSFSPSRMEPDSSALLHVPLRVRHHRVRISDPRGRQVRRPGRRASAAGAGSARGPRGECGARDPRAGSREISRQAPVRSPGDARPRGRRAAGLGAASAVAGRRRSAPRNAGGQRGRRRWRRGANGGVSGGGDAGHTAASGGPRGGGRAGGAAAAGGRRRGRAAGGGRRRRGRQAPPGRRRSLP